MVFKRKDSFFLDLGSAGAKPARVAVQQESAKARTEAPGQLAAAASKDGAPKAGAAQKPTPSDAQAPAASGPVLTTAEAIAAELRAAQEALPPPSQVTFAPDCLNPAQALPSRRRRAGANLAGFKAMAAGLLKS